MRATRLHPVTSHVPLMASRSPRELRTPWKMNRWTLEPLILSWSWILTFGAVLLFVSFAMYGLGTALAVVLVILLWAVVAFAWSRVRAAKNPR